MGCERGRKHYVIRLPFHRWKSVVTPPSYTFAVLVTFYKTGGAAAAQKSGNRNFATMTNPRALSGSHPPLLPEKVHDALDAGEDHDASSADANELARSQF